MYSFPNLEPVHCFMSGSNCCFLTCIQIYQETGKVVWYFHLLKNYPQFVVIHTVKDFWLWTARRSNQSILKEISPEYSFKGLMLKLKLQYFGHLIEDLTHWKSPWCWARLKAREGDDRGWDGWMVSPTQAWVSASSGSWWWTRRPGMLSPWGCKELDMTEWLNWLTDWLSFRAWHRYCLLLKVLPDPKTEFHDPPLHFYGKK